MYLLTYFLTYLLTYLLIVSCCFQAKRSRHGGRQRCLSSKSDGFGELCQHRQRLVRAVASAVSTSTSRPELAGSVTADRHRQRRAVQTVTHRRRRRLGRVSAASQETQTGQLLAFSFCPLETFVQRQARG